MYVPTCLDVCMFTDTLAQVILYCQYLSFLLHLTTHAAFDFSARLNTSLDCVVPSSFGFAYSLPGLLLLVWLCEVVAVCSRVSCMHALNLFRKVIAL